MAAGLGFKDFATGEVLTAADVDGYLMQGVWVFASAAARDAAVTSPQEGNFAYLKDTNVTTYYTGSAWANLDTTGMTNPMTTTGDTIYSSSGSTPARLGIGTAGQVLTVNSGATAPQWAAPTPGGLTLISTTSFSAVASQSINSVFTSTYDNYKVVINADSSATNVSMSWRMRASGTDNTSSNYVYQQGVATGSNTIAGESSQASPVTAWPFWGSGGITSVSTWEIYSPFETQNTGMTGLSYYIDSSTGANNNHVGFYRAGATTVTTSYDGFTFFVASGTMTGKVSVYGYAK
jgi:hypothetical protein